MSAGEAVPAEEGAAQKRYVYGWSLAPASSNGTFDKFHPVDMSDACNTTGGTPGTLFTTVHLDADGHVKVAAYTLLTDNERTESWDKHNEFRARGFNVRALGASTRARSGRQCAHAH